MTEDRLTAVILAGGRSHRLGRDKRLLGIGDRDLLSDTWQRIAQLGLSGFVAVAADQSDRLPILSGLAILHDPDPGAGPLAALCGVIRRLDSDLLLLATDLPDLGSDTLTELLGCGRQHPGCAVVPAHDGGLEPLCAVYPRSVHPGLLQRHAAGETSLQRALAGLDPALWVRWEVAAAPFRNLNRPSEVAAWRSR